MAGTPSQNGITLQFLNEKGGVDTTRPALERKFCWVTSQPQAEKGLGSVDWIKEAYLASTPENLYSLMRTYPPTGDMVPLSTGASQDVVVHYEDAKGEFKSEKWTSAVAEGELKHVKGGLGATETLLLFETLKVTKGDAAKDTANLLHEDFVRQSPLILPTAKGAGSQ